ncbi:LytTR family DNA-binding domain-containing protein [Chitinimonas sp.]|uniref:LytR/AlgR family response regulator transcription factor n=1 Tax=Chitinimonas sp. TaxID=1934313 RepID=UPI002F9330D5
MAITAIIAEDEPILRAQLKAKLAKLWPELEILADVGDGETALEVISELQPQLAFLDIQMPELTGVEVARSLASNRELRCHIVFVTAFDQYAVEAFENGALDYLLKPYSDDRLAAAVGRLKERLGQPSAPPQQLDALLAQLAAKLKPESSRLKWIKASAGNHLRLIPISDVLFFQAGDKYTLVATNEFDALIRTPLKELVDGLDPDEFWQVHRSTIVRAISIETVSRDLRGQVTLKVKGRKETLVVSRPFAHLFKHM